MKILTAKQIKEADRFTIVHEPISSEKLMERAALSCVHWISTKFDPSFHFSIFCGSGNNGGDGLVIARHLFQKGYTVKAYAVKFSNKPSSDLLLNKKRFENLGERIIPIASTEDFPTLNRSKSILIDAIFGSGLNRPVSGFTANLIEHLNQADLPLISIDIPSGLFSEFTENIKSSSIIRANYTLTFELPKLALLLPENGSFIGEFYILPIGLHSDFIQKAKTNFYYLEKAFIQKLLMVRPQFSHKGTFGHALIIAGSKGKMGAAVLSSKACLKSGAGLVTAYVPKCATDILQISVPEVMVLENEGDHHLQVSHVDFKDYKLGIGPGIGQEKETQEFLKDILARTESPMVIDADALNIISSHLEWKKFIPKNSILTPHPKEFQRLVGSFENDEEKLDKLKTLARELEAVIVLKGAHSAICDKEGNLYFNSTGNPGMATAGSGDVLTGILTGLLAQGYPALDAAQFGVYLHGLAGDLAAAEFSQESLTASEIINLLGKAFTELKNGMS